MMMMDRRNTVFVVVHGKKIMKVEIGTERQSRAGRKADISEVDVTRNRLKCRRIDPAMRTWNNTEHRAVIEDYIRTLLWTTGRKECRQGTRVNSDAVAGTTTMNITTAYSIKQTLKLATDIEQINTTKHTCSTLTTDVDLQTSAADEIVESMSLNLVEATMIRETVTTSWSVENATDVKWMTISMRDCHVAVTGMSMIDTTRRRCHLLVAVRTQTGGEQLTLMA